MSRLLALAAAALLAAAAPADDPAAGAAGRDFLPVLTAPETVYLPPLAPLGGHRVPVFFTAAPDAVWLFPAFAVEAVDVRGTAVAVRVRTCLTDAAAEKAVRAAAAAELRDAGKPGTVRPVFPADGTVGVRLVADGPDGATVLGTQVVPLKAGQKLLPLQPFEVPADAAARIAAGTAAAGLEFTARFAGRHSVVDLDATLQAARQAATDFKTLLSSDPAGGRATLLVAFGGTVAQKLAHRQALASRAWLNVGVRAGAEIAPEVIERVMDRLFDGLTEQRSLAAAADAEVCTFVLSNGVRLTGALGAFKGMTDDARRELERRAERADSARDSAESHIKVEAGYLGIGGGADTSSRRERERYAQRSDFKRDLAELQRAVTGDLPVACLFADQVQAVSHRADDVVRVSVQTFAVGEKELTFPVSFDLAADKGPPTGPAPAGPPRPPVTPTVRPP